MDGSTLNLTDPAAVSEAVPDFSRPIRYDDAQTIAHRAQMIRFTQAPEVRETLGQVVRAAWVAWATQQAHPKPSWLVGWADLPEADKEADRQIGETVAYYLAQEGPLLAWFQQAIAEPLDRPQAPARGGQDGGG